MSSFNNNILHNNHQLISREQNYTIECKTLTIHSEDRDINMWPNADEFEITCPQSYNNVQSVSLAQISLPDIFYNFSEELENTKLFYNDVSYIIIPNGSYTHNNLAKILENRLSSLGDFKVKYSSLKHKFVCFTSNDFSFNFIKEPTYEVACAKNKKNIPYTKINWGLPYFLGFQKKKYSTISGDYIQNIEYTQNSEYKDEIDYGSNGQDVLDNFGISDVSLGTYKHFISSEFPIPSSFYKHTIYMELNKMNNMDELKPYINNTTSLCNNDYNGMTNNAFAKIVYRNINNTLEDKINWETIYDNKNNKAIITFDPPLEKLSKFKVKFRLHDGTNVDFLNNEINFSLEMVLLKNEIARSYNVRVPVVYTF